MVKQPQAPPLRLVALVQSLKNKIGTPSGGARWGPHDFLLDPLNSQIKSIRPVPPSPPQWVSKASQIKVKSKVLVGGFRSFLTTPHSIESFVPLDPTTPPYFRSEVWFLKSLSQQAKLCILIQCYTITNGVKQCIFYTVTPLSRFGEKHHARPNQPADSGLCHLGPRRASQCPWHREQPRPVDGIHAGGDPPATGCFVVWSTDKRGDQQITHRPTGLRQLAGDD